MNDQSSCFMNLGCMRDSSSIKAIPFVDRPYEKMDQYGEKALSDAELLAILLRTGKKGQSVLSLSKELLKEDQKGPFFSSSNGIHRLFDLSKEELLSFSGIGPVKARQILAFVELSKRIAKPKNINEKIFHSPQIVAEYLIPKIGYLQSEEVWALMLNTKKQLIRADLIAKGGLNKASVEAREVFRLAVKANACSIVIAHNHPSGDINPSQADLLITKKLIDLGKQLDLNIDDHLIVSYGKWFSLRQHSTLWSV